MKTLTIFTIAFVLGRWCVNVELELAPLLLLAGIGYEAPDEEAMFPCHKIDVQVPTLRLEFRVIKNTDIERAKVQMEQIEAAS